MAETRTWTEMWIDIGYKQAKMCNEDSVNYINCLVKGRGMRLIMEMVYKALVTAKKINKIEEIPLEEKIILWEQTKDFAVGELNLSETIKLSKCLFALEYLLT